MESLLIPFPLKDVTSSRMSSANRVLGGKTESTKLASFVVHTPAIFSIGEPTVRRHEPYNWNWRVIPVSQPVATIPTPIAVPAAEEPDFESTDNQSTVCTALVQFKCHHAEFRSSFEVQKGQYVVVEGDRGIDVGVVIRINTDDVKQYVERTGPTGVMMRYATQREVNYWATDLKADEAAALEYCRQRVLKHRLTMDVRHAEYQFDKKKLTFYYEAKSRVDFVTLNKELFREFSCRIWMEKVRIHE